MQIYRICFFYLWRTIRLQKPISEAYRVSLEKLRNEGYLAVPNFFAPEEYQKIYDEYFALVPDFEKSGSPIDLPHVERMGVHDARVSPFFQKSFTDHKMIREMVTGYLNRNFNLPYEVDLTRIYCKTKEEMESPQNGGTNNLHFDAPLRTLKAFYYLTDTNKENAALKYCVSANKRNSLKRLWLEYKLSIRYALNKDNPDHGGEYKDGEPWVVLTEKEKSENNLREVDMEVPRNTLVFVDIGGFHRRGRFSSTRPRDTVELNFRNMDTLRNELYPLEIRLRKKSNKFHEKVSANVS